MDTGSQVTYQVDGPIATLTLSRPEALNAFTQKMSDQLIDSLDRADADDSVRAVVVTGSGRAFCAGADLSLGTSIFTSSAVGEATESIEHRDLGGILVLRILRSLKPVIAAINGPAVGIGASMTLAMDMRLAASTARIGFVFTKRGIGPDGCSSWLLPRLVGISRAQEWMLTGRLFSAHEGFEAGLIRAVVEPANLVDSARSIALEIATDTSPTAVAVTRRLLWEMLETPSPLTAHQAESRLLSRLGQSKDAVEGVQSFLEKRPPRFNMSLTRDLAGLDS
jgi:enoyl-CoA hydratase/carnithine racemase